MNTNNRQASLFSEKTNHYDYHDGGGSYSGGSYRGSYRGGSYGGGGGGKIVRTNKANPCPICGDTKGKCCLNGDLILCMDGAGGGFDSALWKYLGDSSNGLWGKYVPKRERTPEERQDWARRQQAENQRRDLEARNRRASLSHRLNPSEFDAEFQKLISQLSLSDRHYENLIKRGISPNQISQLGYRTVSRKQKLSRTVNPTLAGIQSDGLAMSNDGDGMLVPIPNKDGLIIGYQIRFDEGDTRYKWSLNSHNKDGELPLGYFVPDSYLAALDTVGITSGKVIGIAEGFTKTPVAANRLNIPIIGAAGSLFLSSKKQFEDYVKGFSVVVLLADSGSVLNKNVINQYLRTYEFCKKLGKKFKVAWYGQTEKSVGDIDEIDEQTIKAIKYITWKQFSQHFSEEVKDFLARNDKKKPEYNYLHYLKSVALTPDRTVCNRYLSTQDIQVPADTKLRVIISDRGTGKTTVLANERQQNRRLVITHLRDLEKQLGIVFGLETRREKTKQGKELGQVVTLDSLYPEANPAFNPGDWAGCDLIIDEIDQLIQFHLHSDTQNNKRAAIYATLKAVLNAAASVTVSSANITQKDLDFLLGMFDAEVKYFVVKNEYKVEAAAKVPAYKFQNKAALLNKQLEFVAAGKRTFTIVGSQKVQFKFAAANIAKAILEIAPNSSILVYDSQECETEGTLAYEINKRVGTLGSDGKMITLEDEFNRYDHVICTTKIQTGVSFTNPHFDAQFHYMTGVLTPQSWGQGTRRLRYPCPMYFTIQKSSQTRVGSGHTSIEKAKLALEKTSKLTVNEKLFADKVKEWGLANYLSGNNKLQHLIDTFLASSCQLNVEYMHYESCLLAILKDEGYFDVKTIGSDKQDDKATYQKMAGISAENNEKQCKAIAAAKRLTAVEFDLLKEKDTNTKETWDNLALTSICLRYFVGENEAVDWKLVDLDRRGFYSKAILAYHFLHPGKAIDYDTAKIAAIINNGVAVPFDVQKATLQKKIDLLHKLKIGQFLKPGERWDNVSVADWFENTLIPLKHEVKDILRLSITDKSYPVATLQDLLRKMGTELKSTRKKGQARIYSWDGWLTQPISVLVFFERYATAHESLPAEVMPAEVMPAEVMPAEVMPAEVIPAGVMPAEVIPAEVMPAGVMPAEVIPAEVIPAEVMPAGVMPAEVIPAEVIPAEVIPAGLTQWTRKMLDNHLAAYYGGKTLVSLSKAEALEFLEDLNVFRGWLTAGDRDLLAAAAAG